MRPFICSNGTRLRLTFSRFSRLVLIKEQESQAHIAFMPRTETTERSLEAAERLCPKCNTAMWVVAIEHGFQRDRRTYECPKCEQRAIVNVEHSQF